MLIKGFVDQMILMEYVDYENWKGFRGCRPIYS